MRNTRILLALAVLLAAGATAAAADRFIDIGRTVAIDPARGADTSVDYVSLTQYGPWDDRNYALTAADLALLAPDEADQHDPIPAFFRVAMRRALPDLRRSGPGQYPRSAFNVFRLRYGGYLVDGALYPGVTWAGGRYYVVMKDGLAPESFSPGTDFVSGEVRVTSPEGAAESAVKIHPSDTNRVVAGTNGPGSGQKMHVSTDGGDTWTETTLPLGGTCCDPAVEWSSNGQYAYATTLGNCLFSCAVWFYRSDDGGATWNGLESVTPGDPRREIATSGGDKEYIHVDKYAGSPFKDNLYVTWHRSNVLQFARSTDFGNTWSTQSFSSASEELGIGSDITTGPDGRVYYLWPAFNSRTIRLKRSSDGGATFGASSVVATTNDGYDFPIPAMESRRAFIYVAADTDLSGGPFHGSVYAAWTDTYGPESSTPSQNHARIQVARSRDGGATWAVDTPHEIADQNSVDRFHPWLGVGPDGTVYVAFYDTRNDPSRTSVDFYYSKSTDGGVTWSTPERLTSVTSPNISDGFEWGDYNGLDVVMHDLITVFTDNRNESGGTGDSVDVYGAGVQAGNPAVCGNDTTEAGEACDGTDLGGRTCADFGCTGGGTLACLGDCSGFDTSGCLGCPTCDGDGVCEAGEDCNNCPSDCVSGSSSGAACGNGVCEAADGEDCVSCPADCAGVQGGKPTGRYCCGGGGGTNPVSCSDPRCTSGGYQCTTVPAVPTSYCCGDLTCSGNESCNNCALDCAGAVEICGNGIDDDCQNGADCSDPTCASSCPTCASSGASCTADGECCSGKCRGKRGSRTCS